MEVTYTAEGVVSVPYNVLKNSPETLLKSIEKAFGSDPDCLGIIVVTDLPPQYVSFRERLLKLADKFATMREENREKYIDPSSRYSFGWSHGKEIMNGQPDTLKGSYYANPVIDVPSVSDDVRKDYPEYYGSNIWPPPEEHDVEGFEEAFKNLGRFIFQVGCELAAACQPFASSYLSDQSLSLSQLISSSQTTKARLLHYFPPSEAGLKTASDDEPVDSWCGFHLDHSLLTGLCSAMFVQHNIDGSVTVVKPPSSKSGLYIRTRGGDLKKASIPVDCLAFQTGEALELATEGKLRATPHCVRVGSGEGSESISRETFALFMQPEVQQAISPKETFGDFSKRIFNDHYVEVKT